MTIDEFTGAPGDAVLAGLGGDIRWRGLRDHVYDRILELLLRGDVAPGARLSIDSIARQLQVSPTPVREAMVQLERTGLVAREAMKGYRVAPPLGPEQLSELFEARLMLESTAARLAAAHAQAMRPALEEAMVRHREIGARVIDVMEQHGETGGSLAADYFLSDWDFHRVIFHNCGNHYIAEMSDALGAQVHRMRQLILRGVIDVNEAVAEHQAIVEAFESADPTAPERAMRTHIERVRARSIQAELDR